MARSSNEDPLQVFNFLVVIPGMSNTEAVAGFTGVSGMTKSVATSEIRGGGDNHSARKSAGRVSYNNITLRRGQIIKSDANAQAANGFINWMNQVHHQQAVGYQDREYRRDLKLIQTRRDGTVMREWSIENAFPVTSTPMSDLDAMNESDNSFEELELAHEGYREISELAPPAPGETNNSVLGVG